MGELQPEVGEDFIPKFQNNNYYELSNAQSMTKSNIVISLWIIIHKQRLFHKTLFDAKNYKYKQKQASLQHWRSNYTALKQLK